MEKLTSCRIDAALERLTQEHPDGFGIPELAVALKRKNTPEFSGRIARHLADDERFFFDAELTHLVAKNSFFTGKYFVITPNELEIEEKILFIGHRFAPFCNPEVFVSDITLQSPRGAPAVKKEVKYNLLQVFPVYYLLGAEQLSDFFVAEHPGNQTLARMGARNPEIIVNAFDLKAFYSRHDFSSGDAILCRVRDYERGIFDFEYRSGNDRRQRDCDAWRRGMDTALERTIDRFSDYQDIPEQFCWAFFLSAEDLLTPAADSLDNFILNSTGIEMKFAEGRTFLGRRDQEAGPGEDLPLPEGLSISRGATGEISQLIRESGSSLTPDELDSFILDSCSRRELEYSDFFARTFAPEQLNFADEAQEAVFHNYVEERFETLCENYNREDDAPKSELRGQILELVDERRNFLSYLRDLEIDASQLPEAAVKPLAEAALHLGNLLHLLNDPGHTISEEESSRIGDAVENTGDIQQKAFAGIRRELKI